MKDIEKNDKKKNLKKDSRFLITWGFGYIFLVVIVALDSSTLIETADVAAMGLTLLVLGIFLPAIVEYFKKLHDRLEQKKYDTGTLARIELEA